MSNHVGGRSMSGISETYYWIKGWLHGIGTSNENAIHNAQQQLEQTYERERAKIEEERALQDRRQQQENSNLAQEFFQRNKQLEEQRLKAERELERKRKELEERMKSDNTQYKAKIQFIPKDDEGLSQIPPLAVKPSPLPQLFGETFSRPGAYGNDFGRDFGKKF
jgi:hypothetical protein